MFASPFLDLSRKSSRGGTSQGPSRWHTESPINYYQWSLFCLETAGVQSTTASTPAQCALNERKLGHHHRRNGALAWKTRVRTAYTIIPRTRLPVLSVGPVPHGCCTGYHHLQVPMSRSKRSIARWGRPPTNDAIGGGDGSWSRLAGKSSGFG